MSFIHSSFVAHFIQKVTKRTGQQPNNFKLSNPATKIHIILTDTGHKTFYPTSNKLSSNQNNLPITVIRNTQEANIKISITSYCDCKKVHPFLIDNPTSIYAIRMIRLHKFLTTK
jgi:hypothetical protein